MSIDHKARPGRPDLFTSAKTSSAIPARHPALRRTLVRASLDPQVREITHVQTAQVGAASVELDVVVVERGGDFFHLDVVPARRCRSVEHEGMFRVAMIQLRLPPLVVTAEFLDAEPMRSNYDLVWSHRGRPVAVDLRMQILHVLADDGPMTLDRLLAGVCGRDPAAAAMSLACEDLLQLDLESGPIGPATMVRTRT